MVNTTLSEGTQKQVKDLFVLEMFFATMIPLVLNILWAPVLDDVFNGKYGSVNAMEFMILSICIPIQFYINLLWTLGFSARKYKQISTIIASTAFINIGLNAVLIPFYGGMGAAIAFLATSIMQLVGYYRLSDKYVMKFSSLPLFSFLLIGAVSYIAAVNIVSGLWMQVGLAVFLYVAIALVLKQVNTGNVKSLLTLLKK
jgi:O-antigen/teichoic acid export membrane protein